MDPCLPPAQSFTQFQQALPKSVISILYGKVNAIESFNAGAGCNLLFCAGRNCIFKMSSFVNANTPALNLNVGDNIAVTLAVKDYQLPGATESYLKKGSGTGMSDLNSNSFSFFRYSHLDLSANLQY
jgi:hypothetical protein